MRGAGTVRAAVALVLALAMPVAPAIAQSVPLKSLGRFDGWRENALVGYGLVTGLAGSGDTRRSVVTRQALRNVLSRLGTSVTEDQLSSRNVAVVMVTAVLPPSANVGDRIDVTVSSIGDARSLAGGTLIMTPLLGPDQRTYALAQGPLLVGGYRFDADLNQQQRNYPTTAVLQGGGTIEAPVESMVLRGGNEVAFLLANPSFSTSQRIAEQINARFGYGTALAKNADEVRIRFAGAPAEVTGFVAQLENVRVEPDIAPRIVINERTGTVVAGGDVMISSVAIAQGDIKVTVTGERSASQPGGFYGGFANDVSSLIVTNTKLEVAQGVGDQSFRFPNTSVADLVQALSRAHVDTRRMISILQAIKTAGALHAEIIVQQREEGGDMESISTALIAKALDGLTARYQATAQNIANANSPNYRPIRVTFEDSLRSAATQGGGAIAGVEPKVELEPMPRIASEMRLDLEIANASQTAMRYGALLSILGRQMELARTIVSGGR